MEKNSILSLRYSHNNSILNHILNILLYALYTLFPSVNINVSKIFTEMNLS